MDTIIVTRHSALLQYLEELELVPPNTPVISHATLEQIQGKHVVGILPNFLSCETESLTEVPLRIPPELRGKELTLEEIREFAGDPANYKIQKI